VTDIFVGAADPSWLTCFPETAIDQVIGYVARSWVELARRFPRSHHAGEREPVLTKSLADYLDEPARRRAAAMGGRFHAERPVNRRPQGKIKAIGRTDIEYHYPAPGSAALTLEFKKLQGTHHCRNAYRNKGIVKFLAGTYGTGELSGVMCGLVTCGVEAEAVAMRASIARCRRQLGCVQLPNGAVASESKILEAEAVVFETNHTKVASSDPIHLHHVFIPLASAPT
jgi:hypothetical protein